MSHDTTNTGVCSLTPTLPPPVPNVPTTPMVKAVSGGLKAWCILCIIATTFLVLRTLFALSFQYVPRTRLEFTPFGYAMDLACSAVVIMGVVFIWQARRIGLYLVFAVAAIALIVNLPAIDAEDLWLNTLLTMRTMRLSPVYAAKCSLYLLLMILSPGNADNLVGLLSPLIPWLLVRRRWSQFT